MDIANDGTVPFRSGERISFNYLVSKKYTAEKVSSQNPDHCTPTRNVYVGQSASLVVTRKELRACSTGRGSDLCMSRFARGLLDADMSQDHDLWL